MVFFRPFSHCTMNKTRKSISKRFKITGTGKLMRRKAGHRHLLRNKTVKQRRSMRKDHEVPESHARILRAAMRSG